MTFKGIRNTILSPGRASTTVVAVVVAAALIGAAYVDVRDLMHSAAVAAPGLLAAQLKGRGIESSTQHVSSGQLKVYRPGWVVVDHEVGGFTGAEKDTGVLSVSVERGGMILSQPLLPADLAERAVEATAGGSPVR